MKTKNIFRMLLVAVILLLGANNVMADTHKLTYQITNPDWSTEVYTTYDIEEGAAIPSEPAPEARIGQTFGGWENVPEKMPNYDLTIIGKFTAIQYAITINSAEHGTLSIYSGATATYGQEITIHPNAEYGYEVESISVVDENNNSLDLTSDYTFTMPACAVTISGTFKPKAAPTYNITLVYNSSQGSATLSKDTSSGNEEIQLTVTPNDGFEVESVTATDANGAVQVWGNYTFRVNASDVTVNITFKEVSAPPTYSITLNYDSSKGTASLSKETSSGNEEIQLTVTPNDGFEVESVTATDANGAMDVWGNYTFWMNCSDVTVTITFRSNVKYNINVNQPETGGSIWVDKQTAAEGETVTVAANPWDKYEVESFYYTDSNDNRVDITSSQFQMPASDIWLTATFKASGQTPDETLYNINIIATGGTVTVDKTQAKSGEEVTITSIEAYDGYQFQSLTVTAGDNTIEVNDNKFIMPASDITITATFTRNIVIPENGENEHSLWTGTPVTAEGSDGHLPTSLSADLFTDIKEGDSFRVYVFDINNSQNWKLYITDNANSWGSQVFEDFTGGDIMRDNGGSAYYHAEDGYGYFEFTCNDQSVTNFTTNGTQMSFTWMTVTKVTYISNSNDNPPVDVYTVTIDENITNGTVSANPTSASEGQTIELTVTPALGYMISTVTVNDTEISATDGTYTFTMPASNVTVSATFSAIPYTVTIAEGIEHGTVSINDQKETYTVGEPVTLSVVPEEGYELRTLYRVDEAGNTVEIDKSNYTFTMPASNVTVNATFGKIGYKVNFEITGEGTVTADQSSYEEGETVWITATPETGHSLYTLEVSPEVSDWTSYGNGRYSFTMPASPVTISATFTINTWTITYYLDGEYYGQVSYDYGANVTPFDDPTPTDDSRFSGWSTIPETMPDHDVRVDGYWIGIVMARITSSTGYASFSSVKPLDFTNVQGITAYIVVDADLEGNTASLHAVTGEIAANTGLILKGSTGTEVEIPTATSAGNSYDSKNWLVAVSEETTFRYDSGCFLLVERNGEAMFAEANSGVSKSVAAGHAYLYAPHASSAQGRYLRFVGDDTTGISDVKASLTSDEVIYNLRGQRVEKPNKGLYIINGKKVVLK